MFTVYLSRFDVNNNFKYCVVVVRATLISMFSVIKHSTIAIRNLNNGNCVLNKSAYFCGELPSSTFYGAKLNAPPLSILALLLCLHFIFFFFLHTYTPIHCSFSRFIPFLC